MFHTLQLVGVIGCFGIVVIAENWEKLILEDPSLWPGHLEPFGTQQQTAEIDVLESWPDPSTFFMEYVDKNKPVLFKGMAKSSPGYLLFDDEYLKSFNGADTAIIYAEPEKKENRTKEGFQMSMKEFIERYQNENLYLVNSLPKQLCQHIRMPAPLRCNDTRHLMKMQVTWLSSGGTKSVLHNDNVDNVNCLFRGTKELWMIEYSKNKKYIPLDQVQGAYSSLDVEKVNYTKYPDLRKVDKYYKVDMNEGDCIFIPYLWFHQVNSLANTKGQNLAVNVWFEHVYNHQPKQCDISESEATIDKYSFSLDKEETKKETEKEEGKEKEKEEGEDEPSKGEMMLKVFNTIILRSKKKSITIKGFLKILIKHKLFNHARYQLKHISEEFYSIGERMFNVIDVNGDGMLTQDDINEISSMEEKDYEFLIDSVERNALHVELHFRDLLDEMKRETLLKSSNASTHAEKNKEEL